MSNGEFKLYELKLKYKGKLAFGDCGKIESFDDAVPVLRRLLDDSAVEKVYALLLDPLNDLIGVILIAQGGTFGVGITAPDVIVPALLGRASGIILGHNHPSGDPTPSSDDIEMTQAVAQACDVVGVTLLDHIVVARGGASSIAELLRTRAA